MNNAKSENCIFCKIASGNSPAKVILENDDIVVFKDINPVAPVHFLIVPKDHVVDMKDSNLLLMKSIHSQMFQACYDLAQKLSGDKSFNIKVNNGASAQQFVFHLHWHFLSNNTLV